MNEHDAEIHNVVDKLVGNRKALELVKLMKPLDVAKVIAVDLELCPKSAVRTTANLIKHAYGVRHEGISSPAIETNKEYPVPAASKKNKPKLLKFKTKDENALARPAGKVDITPKFVYYKFQFPQDPLDDPGDWPYDDQTVVGLKPSTKSRKRPLMTGKKKGILNPNLKKGQPGGDGAGGGGLYQRTIHFKDNPTSTAGTSTWQRRGMPGWSSSPSGKRFDIPGEEKEEAMGGGSRNVNPRLKNAGDNGDEPSFTKEPPVGSSIPTMSFGGRTPKTSRGWRGYRRR
jgi:hypothetical protein